jgi:hypothetical protein
LAGEAYFIGMTGAPVSFAPYLEDFARQLENPYLLSFVPKHQKKAAWQQVRVGTEVHTVDLLSAGRVYVGGEP